MTAAPLTAPQEPPKRAIGIVRVSEQGDRSDETFHSPQSQREAIERLCANKGWQLHDDDVHVEINVSGGALLEDRPGLSRAVTAVLTGHAQVIVALDSSRLWRSTEVRQNVLRLVQRDGGEVWTVKDGEVSQRSARSKFGGLVQTGADEMYREEIAEKSAEGQRAAAEKGIPPMALPPGLVRRQVGTDKRGNPILGPPELDPVPASVVAEAVRMRAAGATIAKVRTHLAEHGIVRSYHGTQSLIASPLLCGRFVFGKDRRPDEQLAGELPQIVDEDTWRAAQISQPRGPRPSSARLLARAGVLRCGTCGSRMIAATQQRASGLKYPFYRCGRVVADCPRRVTISAVIVERVVIDAVRSYLDGCIGVRAAQDAHRSARAALQAAQDEMDSAIRTLTGFTDEPAAVERLRELRAVRDRARQRVDRLGAPDEQTILLLAEEWDSLSVQDRRRCIRATHARVTVTPGVRGVTPEDRIEVVYHDGHDRLTGKTPSLPTELA